MRRQRFGLGQRRFVARGVCQGRVVLPVAQVREHQAHRRANQHICGRDQRKVNGPSPSQAS